MLTKYYDSMLKPLDVFDTFRFFDDFYRSSTGSKHNASCAAPYRADVTDAGLELALDLPGVKAKDLSVQVVDRSVIVSGKLRGEDFKHAYRISKDHDPASVEATLEDGVLSLRFSRTKELQARNVEVKVK